MCAVAAVAATTAVVAAAATAVCRFFSRAARIQLQNENWRAKCGTDRKWQEKKHKHTHSHTYQHD